MNITINHGGDAFYHYWCDNRCNECLIRYYCYTAPRDKKNVVIQQDDTLDLLMLQSRIKESIHMIRVEVPEDYRW
jgi:hypothetical protein